MKSDFMKLAALMGALSVVSINGPSSSENPLGGTAPDFFPKHKRGKGQNNRRGKGKRSPPKHRSNRLTIGKRVRRKHRRAAQ